MFVTSRLLFFYLAIFVGANVASPVGLNCFDCPGTNKHGAGNSFQDMHHGGLICFYSGMSAACSYEATTGEAWREIPSDCLPTAQPVHCSTEHDSSSPAARPPVKAGSIMGVMKGKMGNRLTAQQREEKARILADLLAGGQFGA
ncbi:hypothetical protein DACRYDRAFT_24381 [Dacryopinax primogenitus]|uniref:Uncharacterized protein n=1 Tax=Dacryopinax primogenitus (strain DJM 731) TaxID=1858805 RepID=M5FRI8_DACPD|nr:uncharacterized protein DACRYDRAFT_24381 [Dacryopinax primogenitus]EJT98303.1 hypothetical protein DACRYDRAFT_24381 [Dacryopinax primogenitus]